MEILNLPRFAREMDRSVSLGTIDQDLLELFKDLCSVVSQMSILQELDVMTSFLCSISGLLLSFFRFQLPIRSLFCFCFLISQFLRLFSGTFEQGRSSCPISSSLASYQGC